MINMDIAHGIMNNNEVLDYIPSKTLRDYLKSDQFREEFSSKENSDKKHKWNSFPNWSYLQLATLADLYMPNRKKVRYLRKFAKNSNNQNEKHLFRLMAKDKAKYRYTNNRYSAETIIFFRKHFSKPFTAGLCEELLFFPVIFQAGDVVSCRNTRSKRSKTEYYIVAGIPDYEKDCMVDYSDEYYCLLDLDGMSALLDENQQVYWHTHISPACLERVPENSIPAKYKEIVNKMRQLYDWEEENRKNYMSGIHFKEEMAERIRNKIDSIKAGKK